MHVARYYSAEWTMTHDLGCPFILPLQRLNWSYELTIKRLPCLCKAIDVDDAYTKFQIAIVNCHGGFRCAPSLAAAQKNVNGILGCRETRLFVIPIPIERTTWLLMRSKWLTTARLGEIFFVSQSSPDYSYLTLLAWLASPSQILSAEEALLHSIGRITTSLCGQIQG